MVLSAIFEIVELLEQLADVAVELDHAVRIEPESRLADGGWFQVREDVHPRWVEIAEPRTALFRLPIDEIERRSEELLIHSLHALLGERPRVLDRLFAHLAELRVDCRVVLVGRFTLQHAARAVFLSERRVLRIVRIVGLFLGIEVVEVSEELIESVHGGQMLVAIAEVVLAELAGRIAEILHELPNRGILEAQTERRAWRADLGEAGSDWRLASNKGGASGSATLLPIEIGKHRAFLGDAIDVRRLVTHDAVVVATGIEPANVVGHDEENVGLVCAAIVDYSFSISFSLL